MTFQRPVILGCSPEAPFPNPTLALDEPNGLLAIGGDLSPERLLNAYRQGIFPWYSEGQPLLWWSPSPRTVFRTDRVHLSRRFKRQLRQSDWVLRADTAFKQVIEACASSPRLGQDGTWITDAMREAYTHLHRLGHAHSVEVWADDILIGGIYGVAIGQMFFGESMFSAYSGGSKAALAALAQQLHRWGWPLMDAQVPNNHLARMGAESWSQASFLEAVARQTALPAIVGLWTNHFGEQRATDVAGN